MKPGDIYLEQSYQVSIKDIANKEIIYEPVSYRKRIMMFDDQDVFTEPLFDGENSEIRKSKTIIYSRTPRNYFDENSSFIASYEFSSEQLAIHRPDLPLRLNCFKDIFYSDKRFESIGSFSSFLASEGIAEDELNGLHSNKVVIFLTSQQTSSKKQILLENTSGFFSGLELMFNCFQAQSEHVRQDKPYFSRFRLIPDGREEKRLNGIGLYRLGIKGNIPSYYLGGSISMMQLEWDKSRVV